MCPVAADCVARRDGSHRRAAAPAAAQGAAAARGARAAASSAPATILLEKRPPRRHLGRAVEPARSSARRRRRARTSRRASRGDGRASAATAVEHGFTHFALTMHPVAVPITHWPHDGERARRRMVRARCGACGGGCRRRYASCCGVTAEAGSASGAREKRAKSPSDRQVRVEQNHSAGFTFADGEQLHATLSTSPSKQRPRSHLVAFANSVRACAGQPMTRTSRRRSRFVDECARGLVACPFAAVRVSPRHPCPA